MTFHRKSLTASILVLCVGAALLLWWAMSRVGLDSNQHADSSEPGPRLPSVQASVSHDSQALVPSGVHEVENNPALPAPAGLFEGIETCEQLLSSVQQAEISRIIHTTAHLDQHEQFIREYVIAAPSRDESSAVLEKLSELSKSLQGEEYAPLRDAIHDLFDYREKYKIIRIIHSLGESRTKWYQTLEVYDAAEVSAVEDESGRLRSFRPAGTDMPEFSPTRPSHRYSAIMALHAAGDDASREAAAIELRKLPPRKPFKRPDPPAFPAGTPENPAG